MPAFPAAAPFLSCRERSWHENKIRLGLLLCVGVFCAWWGGWWGRSWCGRCPAVTSEGGLTQLPWGAPLGLPRAWLTDPDPKTFAPCPASWPRRHWWGTGLYGGLEQ